MRPDRPAGPGTIGDASDGAGERGSMPTDELTAAYVDGVAEMSPDERRRIEGRLASDPSARAEAAALRGVLDRLRAVPSEGTEPDWTALERSIRAAVGDRVPRPWWRRWTWLAPVTTLATAAVVLLLVWGRPVSSTPKRREGAVAALPTSRAGADARPGAPDEVYADDAVALWLDGAEVDVDPAAANALVVPDEGVDSEPTDFDEVGLLPSTNLAWVDNLDDAAIDRAERWLAGKKG